MRSLIGRLHDVLRRFGYEVTPRPLDRPLRLFGPDLVLGVGADEGPSGREPLGLPFVPTSLAPAFAGPGTRRWLQADVPFLRETGRA